MSMIFDPRRGQNQIVERSVAKKLSEGVGTNDNSPSLDNLARWMGGEVFNVKAYGAGGAGAGDDSLAIQTAINAAQAVYGTVFFPPGTYRYGTTLNITKRVRLLGGGVSTRWRTWDSGAILEYTGSGNGILVQSSTLAEIFDNIEIENLDIRPETSGNGAVGILFDASDATKCLAIEGPLLRNVTVQNWGTDGVQTKGTVFDMTFQRCSFLNNTRYGFYNDNTGAQSGNASQLGFYDCWFVTGTAATSWAAMFLDAVTVRLLGGTVAGAGSGNGLWIRPGTADIIGVSIEGASGAGTFGVRYSGQSGLKLFSTVSDWGTGVQIGDPDNTSQRTAAWLIGGYISGNTTTDLHIVAGEKRWGTVLAYGYTNVLNIVDDRKDTNGVHGEWNYLGSGTAGGVITEYSDGDKIYHENATAGFVTNANIRFDAGAWNTAHPVLGAYHLWVDATGDLRIKSGAPTTDLDGTVVGAQS